MSFGPRIPFAIPNEGDKTQTGLNAEELMEYPLTKDEFWGSHNGRQRDSSKRPTANAGRQPMDKYKWEES